MTWHPKNTDLKILRFKDWTENERTLWKMFRKTWRTIAKDYFLFFFYESRLSSKFLNIILKKWSMAQEFCAALYVRLYYIIFQLKHINVHCIQLKIYLFYFWPLTDAALNSIMFSFIYEKHFQRFVQIYHFPNYTLSKVSPKYMPFFLLGLILDKHVSAGAHTPPPPKKRKKRKSRHERSCWRKSETQFHNSICRL